MGSGQLKLLKCEPRRHAVEGRRELVWVLMLEASVAGEVTNGACQLVVIGSYRSAGAAYVDNVLSSEVEEKFERKNRRTQGVR